jgi:DNA-binding MarR family transcriptional regulator
MEMIDDVKIMVVFGKLHSVFMNTLDKNLESLNMPSSAYEMLVYLNEVGRTKTQTLGEIARITSGSITHMVNKLEKQGYIVKIQDEEDKRVFWIEITDFGRKEFLKVHTEHLKYLKELLSDFTKEEKEVFIEQVKYFGKTIEKKKECM